jgi:hypothetical protein
MSATCSSLQSRWRSLEVSVATTALLVRKLRSIRIKFTPRELCNPAAGCHAVVHAVSQSQYPRNLHAEQYGRVSSPAARAFKDDVAAVIQIHHRFKPSTMH